MFLKSSSSATRSAGRDLHEADGPVFFKIIACERNHMRGGDVTVRTTSLCREKEKIHCRKGWEGYEGRRFCLVDEVESRRVSLVRPLGRKET